LSLTNGNFGPSFDLNTFRNMNFFDRDLSKDLADSQVVFDIVADGAVFDEDMGFEVFFD